eukprot:1831954-Alexandrium_andersonii.AAC.1
MLEEAGSPELKWPQTRSPELKWARTRSPVLNCAQTRPPELDGLRLVLRSPRLVDSAALFALIRNLATTCAVL